MKATRAIVSGARIPLMLVGLPYMSILRLTLPSVSPCYMMSKRRVDFVMRFDWTLGFTLVGRAVPVVESVIGIEVNNPVKLLKRDETVERGSRSAGALDQAKHVLHCLGRGVERRQGADHELEADLLQFVSGQERCHAAFQHVGDQRRG